MAESHVRPLEAGGSHSKINLEVIENDLEFDNERSQFVHDLPVFDPTQMEKDAAVVVLGKRRTGKSHTVRSMHSQDPSRYKAVVVFTKTKFNGYWQEVVPAKYVHEGFDEEKLWQILKVQKKRKAENIIRKKEGREEEDITILLILDDVVSDSHLHGSEVLKEYFTAGRHYGVSVWLLSQYIYAFGPMMRSNCDYVIIMHQNQWKSKKTIVEEWMSQVPTRDGATILGQHTQGYQALVIDNTAQSDNLSDVLFKYLAPKDIPDYTMGDEQYYRAANAERNNLQQQQTNYARQVSNQGKNMDRFPSILLTMEDGGAFLRD